MKRVKTESEKKFYEGNKLNISLTIISQVLAATLNIGFAFMMQYFIEAVEYSSIKFLIVGVYCFVGYMLIYSVFSFLQRNYKNKYLRKALSQFKDYIFQNMLKKSISEYGDGTLAKFISAFSNDLNSIETNFLNGTLQLVSTILHFIASAVAIMYINIYIGIPSLLVSSICIILSLKYGQKLIKKENDTSEENMLFVSQVKDILSGFIVIKSFKAEKEVLDIFQKKNMELEKTKQGRRVTSDTVSIYGDLSSIIVNVIICGCGFIFAFKGFMSIGSVIALIQLSAFIVAPVRTVAPILSNRKAALRLIERLSEEVERNVEVEKGLELKSFESSIQFKNLSFGYEDGNEILHSVNITFEKGKSYAIVGGSGSGKSTLLKLLLGYYGGYSGNLLFDGNEMKDVDLESLYDMISIIQQDVFLFDSSIKDNITMFKEFNEHKLKDAIIKSGLSDLVGEKGEEYSCGEGGKNLSGGEKQRVSIARCLIRETPVLLMDEATASLDNSTALMVENAILNIDDITRIIVTHRFNENIMKKYDEIIVMNKGSIIERGTFEELIEGRGYFYSLYDVSKAE
ncbi:MAG: ABC transporter ATP-binding protein [Clostridium sp.]|nr:ABC transporter ATP-binding protein [Clostridium sp.]